MVLCFCLLCRPGSDSWTAAERRQFNKGITAYKKDFFMVQKQVRLQLSEREDAGEGKEENKRTHTHTPTVERESQLLHRSRGSAADFLPLTVYETVGGERVRERKHAAFCFFSQPWVGGAREAQSLRNNDFRLIHRRGSARVLTCTLTRRN